MDRGKIILLLHTLRHLRFVQVYYRLYYYVKNKFFKRNYSKLFLGKINFLRWQNLFYFQQSNHSNNTFEFLNLSYKFDETIDWNYSNYGKLWTYNLNYFDFLNQENVDTHEGIRLIKNYIENNSLLMDGKEPYPISLRGINWIKFLSRNKISNIEINQTLYNHYQILLNNLEYHLLGNHLLENGFSLLFGAYFFEDKILYNKAKQILTKELKEQILADGAHFELSPMYHQIILHRLLDSIHLLQLNNWKQKELLGLLKAKAKHMLSWLEQVTFNNGNIPMVNDSAYNIAPTTSQLLTYAKSLGLNWDTIKLSESGYRIFKNSQYEFLVDVGNIGPTYQPGHAHSDTFNFELHINNTPIIVDTGISTYEKNAIRQYERSTSAHNTVQIGSAEQSEIWGGFRVGRRAKIISFEEDETIVKASHDGYKSFGITHERAFKVSDNEISIKDKLSNSTNLLQKAYFHFHPDVTDLIVKDHSISVKNSITINLKGSTRIEVSDYQYATGFNKTKKAKKITIYFDRLLKTQINI
jgi:hypothetical protein